MTITPKPGDWFRVYNRHISASGKVLKVNRVNLVYESRYQVGNVDEIQTLKLPLCYWSDAKVIRDGKLLNPTIPIPT